MGNTIVTSVDIRSQDVKYKRAAFKDRNNIIFQEFHFVNPRTTSEVNKTFNSHFYGSVLWSLSSREVVKLEKSPTGNGINFTWQSVD